jgi:hypothetical protein
MRVRRAKPKPQALYLHSIELARIEAASAAG